MATNEPAELQSSPDAAGKFSDRELLARLARGDEFALRTFMDRYDRLVRYTVFRVARRQCLRDPQWLDAVAGETWTGLIKASRRSEGIKSEFIAGYLSGIARQQTVSALRRAAAFAERSQTATIQDIDQATAATANPASLVEELNTLSRLRDCLSVLPTDDQPMVSQLSLIMQRKWVEAAANLGVSESTLRSRWARILDDLRDCMEKKETNFAPKAPFRDTSGG